MSRYVWLVNMGIGENCENRKAIRVFSTKHAAFEWVRNSFIEQIKTLDEQEKIIQEGSGGLGIGNSFHIYPQRIDEQ